MKRILLLLLFVVNLQKTITDSAIGLRCGAETHAQTMAREVNGGCEYSDGNGWSLWTPMPCDPVIANGYPCSYCHKGHDTDIQREIHIEPHFVVACGYGERNGKEYVEYIETGVSNSNQNSAENILYFDGEQISGHCECRKEDYLVTQVRPNIWKI